MSGTLSALDDHGPLGDIIFLRLRDAIIDGRLEPGQWLRQEALAQDFGVSQMPVRDALRRLVAEGLAVRIPYKGVRVVEFTAEDVLDMCTVRMVLEALAVRFATPLITRNELERLGENLAEAAACTGPHQMARRRQLNVDFHLIICQASCHRYLVQQLESLWGWFPSVLLYEGMRRQEELSTTRLARESQEHQTILDALEQRDAQKAEAQTRQHIRNLAQELTEVLGISQDLLASLPTF